MSTTKVQLIAPKYQEPSKKGVSVRIDSGEDSDQKVRSPTLRGAETAVKDRDAILDVVARKTAERRRTHQELKKMLPEDRIKATADQRVLQKHSKQQDDWAQMDKGIAAAVGRDESELVHNRLASHREHVEEQHLLRQAVPPQERVGEEYWSLSLRNPTMPDRPFAPRAAAAAAAMAEVQRKLGPCITHVAVGGPVGGLWAKVKEESNEALESVRVPRKSKKSPTLPPLGSDQTLVRDLGIPVTSGDVRSPSSLSSFTASGYGSPTPEPGSRGDSRLSGSTAVSAGRGGRRRTEREGSFTKSRKNQLQKRLKNIMHHDPSALNDLCITGTDLFSEPAPPQELLGSLPHVQEHHEDQDAHLLSELKYADDELPEQSTQPAIKGPAIEVSHTRLSLRSDTPLRLSGDSIPQWPPLSASEHKNAYATLTLKNTGSTAIHYWWELAEPLFPNNDSNSVISRNNDTQFQVQITAPQSPRAIQRAASLMSPRGSVRTGRTLAFELGPFQSSCSRGVILPGDSSDSVWSFVPVAPGVYLKRLRLVTVPGLSQVPTLILEGVSQPIDETEAARERLFKQLSEDAVARREKRDSESVWHKSSITECALDQAVASQPDVSASDQSAPSSAEQLSHQMQRARAVAFQKINSDMCPKLYYQPEVFHAFEHLCELIVSHHRRSLRREFQWNGSIATLYQLLDTLPPRSKNDASMFRNQLDQLCLMASNRPEPSPAACQFFGSLLGDVALRMDRWRLDTAETTGVVADSLVEADLIPKVRTLGDELAHLQAAAAAQPPAAPEQPKESPAEPAQDTKTLAAAAAPAAKRASQTLDTKVSESPLITTEQQLKAASQELIAVQERLEKKRQEMAAAMYSKVKRALVEAIGDLCVNFDPQQAPSENGPALQQRAETVVGRWDQNPNSLSWIAGECPVPAQPIVLSSQPTLPLESVTQVASAQSLIYALSADGEVFVAKSPALGPSTSAKSAPRLSWRLLEFTPSTRNSNGTIQKLAVGPQRVLAITSSQRVISWTHPSSNDPVQWHTLSLQIESEAQEAKALSVSCSPESDFGLILSTSGRVFVVGSAAPVLVGEAAGAADAPLVPKIVSGFDDKPVALIAAGAQHALAVTTIGKNSQLWVWGDNSSCQLGTGDKKPKNIPTFVPLAPISGKEKDKEKDALAQPEIVSIACGPRHSIVMTPTQIFSFGTGAGAVLGHADLVNKDGSSKEQKAPRALTIPTPPSGPLAFSQCALVAGAKSSVVIGKFGALFWGSVPMRSLPPPPAAPTEAKGKPAAPPAQPTSYSENVPKLFAAEHTPALVPAVGAETECGLLVSLPRSVQIHWTPPPPTEAAAPVV